MASETQHMAQHRRVRAMRDFTFCANTFLEGSNQSEIRNEIDCYRVPQPPLWGETACWLGAWDSRPNFSP